MAKADRTISSKQKNSLQQQQFYSSFLEQKRFCSGFVKIKGSFRHICKEVKEAVKVAKEKEWVRFGNELQDSFYNKSKLFWKKVKGANNSQRGMLKNEEGVLMDDDKNVADWCAEYFKRLYIEGYMEETVQYAGENIIQEDERFKDTMEEPTLEEIRRSVQRLKNGR